MFFRQFDPLCSYHFSNNYSVFHLSHYSVLGKKTIFTHHVAQEDSARYLIDIGVPVGVFDDTGMDVLFSLKV